MNHDDGNQTRDLWCQKQPASDTVAPFACCLYGPKARSHRPGSGRLGPGWASDPAAAGTSAVHRTGLG